MSQDKQPVSPSEWRSVTDYVIELSQRVAQALSAPPASQSGNGSSGGKQCGPVASKKD